MQPRFLTVVADDLGIGPETTRSIVELGAQGLVTGAVLLVNSPYAEPAVSAWQRKLGDLDLGWHPCLTLDRPVLAHGEVASLVTPEGRFHSLGQFVRRAALGLLRAGEIQAELQAQYRLFQELAGGPPALVNSHQHVQVFSPVSDILREVLDEARPLPYVRRIREPWPMLVQVPGARLKRLFLGWKGRRDARAWDAVGAPGNDWLAGITDPAWVRRPDYLVHWLSRIPGRVVELACHPGYWDGTLVGRDCTDHAHVQRRVDERQRLLDPAFLSACRQAGFQLVPPSAVGRLTAAACCRAA